MVAEGWLEETVVIATTLTPLSLRVSTLTVEHSQCCKSCLCLMAEFTQMPFLNLILCTVGGRICLSNLGVVSQSCY